MKDHYVQAVLESLKEGKSPDAVLTGLVQVLKAKGHESLFGAILRGVLRVVESASDRSGAVVTVARTSDEQNHIDAIKSALERMGAPADYTLKEDDTLIGGFVAEVNNTVHDASHKKALVDLYRNLTK